MKIIFSLLLVVAFALPQQAHARTTAPVPFEQIYREMQSIVYGEYGGSQTGIDIADAYLFYWYGLTTCDVWFLHDMCGYTGMIP